MGNNVFSKRIPVQEGDLEFHFAQLEGDLPNFQVNVIDSKGNNIQFSMNQNKYGAWHSAGTLLPMWIISAEHVIGEVIEEEIHVQH